MNATVKKTGRKRRAAGWTLLMLGLLVAGLWAASGWYSAEYGSDEQRYTLRRGSIAWSLRPQRWRNGDPMQFNASTNHPDDRGWNWWDSFSWQPPDYVSIGVYAQMVGFDHGVTPPLDTGRLGRVMIWPIPLLLWVSAALLLRSGFLARRRANTSSCAKCGYSLAGLSADSPCPECGKAGTISA